MIRDIERRLQKLESQVPPPPPADEEKAAQVLRRFLMCAIAFYLGDPTPGGSVFEAYSRALGYSHGLNFKRPYVPKIQTFFERDRSARIKLLEKFGVSWESEWKEIVAAFERMEAGFSEHYKNVSRATF